MSLLLRSLPLYLFFLAFFTLVGIYGFYWGFGILALFCCVSFYLFHIEAKRKELPITKYWLYLILLPAAANFLAAILIGGLY